MRNHLIISLFFIIAQGNCLMIKADMVSELNSESENAMVIDNTNDSTVQKEAESEKVIEEGISESDSMRVAKSEQDLLEAEEKARQDSIHIVKTEQDLRKAKEKAKQDSIRIVKTEQDLCKAKEKAKQDSTRIAKTEQDLREAEMKARQDSAHAATVEQDLLEAEEKAKQDRQALQNAKEEAARNNIKADNVYRELIETKETQKNLNFVLLLLMFLLLILMIIHRRKNKKMTVESKCRKGSSVKHEKEIEGVGQKESKHDTATVDREISEDTDGNIEKNTNPPLKPEVLPISISPTAKWVIVGASVKGTGHIQSNMPCQDNHMFESLDNGWGVAIVSDGAGSAAHSELGSKIVVSRGIFHFKNLIEKERWIDKQSLPTDIEWFQKSYAVLKEIRNDVMMVAQKNNIDVKSLSATCLVVIYSPFGLLTVHVGDGRMGYKSMSGEWKSMMTPHKGEEANQTIFLVSDFWSIPNYEMSSVLVPECRVIRENVKAFALMSDGCENTAWLCSALNSDTGKYEDRNLPFDKFFNPLEETLLMFDKNSILEEERQSKWYKFIESGTSGFTREQDDKTMIYAINVDLVK